MKLTPLDIRKKEFRKVMRGSDPVEVEEFLEEVSDNVMELSEANKKLEAKIVDLETEKRVLEDLQNSTNEEEDDEKVFAEREAKMVIREAELKALEILERSKAESNRLKEEIVTLKHQKQSFLKRLKHIFDSQLELIQVMEIDDFDPSEFNELKKKASKIGTEFHQSSVDVKKSVSDINIDIDVIKNSSSPSIESLPFIKKKSPVEKELGELDFLKTKSQERQKRINEKKQSKDPFDEDFDRIFNELE